jgi:hypothetical protein
MRKKVLSALMDCMFDVRHEQTGVPISPEMWGILVEAVNLLLLPDDPDDPLGSEARSTLDRLMALGSSEAEARVLLTRLVAWDQFMGEALRETFGTTTLGARFEEGLRALPQLPWVGHVKSSKEDSNKRHLEAAMQSLEIAIQQELVKSIARELQPLIGQIVQAIQHAQHRAEQQLDATLASQLQDMLQTSQLQSMMHDISIQQQVYNTINQAYGEAWQQMRATRQQWEEMWAKFQARDRQLARMRTSDNCIQCFHDL